MTIPVGTTRIHEDGTRYTVKEELHGQYLVEHDNEDHREMYVFHPSVEPTPAPHLIKIMTEAEFEAVGPLADD